MDFRNILAYIDGVLPFAQLVYIHMQVYQRRYCKQLHYDNQYVFPQIWDWLWKIILCVCPWLLCILCTWCIDILVASRVASYNHAFQVCVRPVRLTSDRVRRLMAQLLINKCQINDVRPTFVIYIYRISIKYQLRRDTMVCSAIIILQLLHLCIIMSDFKYQYSAIIRNSCQQFALFGTRSLKQYIIPFPAMQVARC